MGKRSASRRIENFVNRVPAGIGIGMSFFFCLFVLSLLWNSGFSVMGVSNGAAAKLVFTSFWPWVLFAQAKILAVYLIVGFLSGVSAELVRRELFPMVPGIRPIWILGLNAYLFAWNVRKYPQLYAESLYDHGGLFRFLQTVITHKIPHFILSGTGVILGSLLLFAAAMYLARKFGEKIHLAVLATVLALFAVVCVELPKMLPAKNSGPNIMVIAADSFRRDRLGANKYERRVTPNIDKVADRGTVFNAAYTSFPRTFPAVISLLTGELPVTHGVRHMFPDKYHRDHTAGSVVEELRKNGYATAVVSDFAGDVFSRMQLGFEKVRAPYFNFITLIDQRSLELHFPLMPYITNPLGRKIFPELKEFANNADPFMLADETIDTLSGLTRKDKFFCFVFFSNIHFPYASPYPYYLKYTDPSYNGRFKYHKPPAIYGQEAVSEADITQIRALYDGSVEAFDKAAGKILEYLEKRGCLQNTIVIITADHGENLYENDWYIGHGEHLRGGNVLNVPLVIRFPGKQYVKEVNCLTRDIDVSPTLREFLGLKANPKADGESLMPLLEGKKDDLDLFAFAETGIWFSDTSGGFFQKQRIMYPDITNISTIDFTYNMEVVLKKGYEALINTAKHRMVDDGAFRLIVAPRSEFVGYELFDKAADPGFTKNITGPRMDVLLKLEKKLKEFELKDRNAVIKNNYVVEER